MKKSLIALSAFALLASCKPSTPSTEDILSVTSPKGTAVFQDNWENIAANYQCPDWFTDAKFGIFIHWGVYSVPAFGNEWYARNMYVQDSEEYKHHLQTFGNIRSLDTRISYHSSKPRNSMPMNGFLYSRQPEPSMWYPWPSTMMVLPCTTVI